ncbi:MAG: tRNA (adenosine(37)-N6)-threonylcarbamoyltransferase complex ATPase subunit type 1 TsaE [Salana multivorans]|uniref:tRNA (adenosine(37)-N6)-threonylcarbamoyltransferase complex ATPase subunit type 1 TsaE n=1 Tax=Salana multivorans TaxID=120377 RepID=UPI00095B03A9|nr:tRNA (adenosine(37)-N6)-threonylcarbamoyltransferase complex ATPase subunit type 1 TsaE [Salana multivorans]MBN8882816.1 tRNA (adenosine(37)-N6)-threonylcarbamoyltransferase complex ATPase subunit type 1 TsaE [Salana multivorans]OJX97787.1 MAG: tRNA (adenosine(37)-N6)-threonylcarbamoyltransferase complex ATPase subunit type 1 TsaE [Micrococcales bacterium 73-15]
MTTTLHLLDPDATRALGAAIAGLLRAGDLVILTGDLGAGKTTLTQGLGAALGVRGQVASPTFVIAREHPSLVGGPALVHVDAYRLGNLREIDALDLDSSLEESVTVVEWGAGLAERLSGDRLEVRIGRARGDAADAGRDVEIVGVGPRWDGVDLAHLALDEREGRA